MSSLTIASYFPFARMKVVGQNVHLNLEKPGTLVYLEPDLRCRPLCHACGQAGQVHSQGLRRIVRDLNMGPAQTFLQVDYPIGTSPLEGVNNKIKVIKRKAYGFHDPEYFALKVKQALPGGKSTTETG